MKKLSLKNINLSEIEQLSREQLKNVMGGYSGGYTSGPDLFTTEPAEQEGSCLCIRENGDSFYVPNPTGMPCDSKCG